MTKSKRTKGQTTIYKTLLLVSTDYLFFRTVKKMIQKNLPAVINHQTQKIQSLMNLKNRSGKHTKTENRKKTKSNTRETNKNMTTDRN
jgi:hypothetical protein